MVSGPVRSANIAGINDGSLMPKIQNASASVTSSDTLKKMTVLTEDGAKKEEAEDFSMAFAVALVDGVGSVQTGASSLARSLG